MKRVFVSLGVALVFALILLTCAQQTQPVAEEAASTEADVAAIRALVEQWIAALETGDAEGLVGLYTDDAVRLPPDGPSSSGTEVFEEYFRGAFEEVSFQCVWPVEGTEEIIVAGGWAFHLSEYILLVTPIDGGETVEEKGNVVEIIQRQPDGSWKIAREIWNHPPPPETE
jgi:uncharacterized protein (TIGR02246 family)